MELYENLSNFEQKGNGEIVHSLTAFISANWGVGGVCKAFSYFLGSYFASFRPELQKRVCGFVFETRVVVC